MRTARALQHGALDVLLFAGVLTPVVAIAMGWPLYEAPIVAMATTISALLGAVLLGVDRRRGRSAVLPVLLSVVTAAMFAAILRIQSNSFYTSGALLGGMIILLMLHVGTRVLRHVALRDQSRAQTGDVSPLLPDLSVIPALELERVPPNEIRVVRRGGHTAATTMPREEDVPAIALTDRLADVSVWLLAAFWLLVATGHRHVATGALLLTGLLLAARSLAFLPEIIASRAQSVEREHD